MLLNYRYPLRLPPLHFDADSDPAFHFDADPHPTFHSDADPDQIRILPFNSMRSRIRILSLIFSQIWNLHCSKMTL
jgi:hypothetical protein